MASLWQPFERSVVEFLTRTTLSQDEFVKFLAGAYTVATTPISLKYSTGTITQPVVNGVLKQKILRDALTKMLNVNSTKSEQLAFLDYLPTAIGFLKYWTPGIGVLISPLPAAPPCFAPIVAGFAISQDDLNQALDFAGVDQIQPTTGNDLKAKIISSAVVNDPVVLLPSPIVLFPGNPIQLAKDLHFAMSRSFTPQATAKNLVKAFKNHLSSMVGIYIGFKDPATPPQPLPFTIVVFNGIS
jgi:hypothetical protein